MTTDTAQPVPTGLSFRRLALTGRRQWWVVVGCIILAALGSVAYSKTRTVTYTSFAAVEVASPYTGSAASTSGGVGAPLLTGKLDPLQEVEAASVGAAAAKAGGVSRAAVDLGATVDGGAVSISATGSTPASAVTMANAAADAFVKQRLADVTEAAASLDPQLTTLSREIAKLQDTIKSKSTTAAAAKTELNVVQGQYQTMYAQQQEITLAASSITISTKASLSDVASSGSGKKVVEVAVVAGLLAGCGIALAREQFDDKIRSASELAEVTTDVLAELPVSDLGRGKATIADAPSGGMAEAVRELRTAIRFLSVKRPIRTVLVTSAASGEGKSFVAANLAAAWAMSGVRTILVSSDLRKPTLEHRFDATGARRGLSDAIVDAALLGHGRDLDGFGHGDDLDGGSDARPDQVAEGADRDAGHLDGEVDVDDLLVETGVSGLSLLPSGSLPPNPAELLGSPELGKLLVSLRERAEVVVLDSPPVLAVTDALVLTAQVDGVLFVVSVNRTSRSAAGRALRQLESGLAPLLGVVVNRSRRSHRTPY